MNKETNYSISSWGGGWENQRGRKVESHKLSHYGYKIHIFYYNGISENFAPLGNQEERKSEI